MSAFRRAAWWLVGAVLCTPTAQAGPVHIPPVRDGSGALVEAQADIRLIGTDGKPVLGFVASTGELVTEYQSAELGEAGLTVILTPQAAIAMPSGAATYYQVQVRAGHRTETYRVQVPDSGTTQELADLVGAAAIDPASLTAGRLIPPGGAADQALCKVTGDDYDTDWCDSAGTETDPVYAASPAAGIGAQDITDWGAAYSWGDHGLMGYLLPGDDAATLGSDTAIAGYAPLADGAGGIAWGPIAVSAETYAPSVLTVTYGTLTSGTVADLVEKDGTSVAIAEASGAGTALQLTLDFAGVTSFHSLAIFGQYDGSASHQIAVEVWDYDASAWEVYGYLPNTDDPQWHFYTIADPEEHVSAGSAQVRLRHIQTGNTTHDLYLDQVYLSGAVAGGAIAHQDIVGRSVADQHPASAITNTPAGDVAATTVQGAIDELDSEKLAPGGITTLYGFSVGWDNWSLEVAEGVYKANLPMPYGLSNIGMTCCVSTAPTGSGIELDLAASGTSIFSTTLTIDATENCSSTAATPATYARTSLDYLEALSLDIVAVGATEPGMGLKCWIAGQMP